MTLFVNKLEAQLMQICQHNRDGSFATQANRHEMLSLFSRQLHELGYRTDKLNVHDLKTRHVNALLNKWKDEEKSIGTIKNRMAILRWLFKKIGKPVVIKNSNAIYGIQNRQYVTNKNKSISLKGIDLSQIDPNIAQSLRLQEAFGLRREESIKFQPSYALDGQYIDNAKYIRIKSSWAKGGRPRTIPITNEKQRNEIWSAYARAVENGGVFDSQRKKRMFLICLFLKTSQDRSVSGKHTVCDMAMRKHDIWNLWALNVPLLVVLENSRL